MDPTGPERPPAPANPAFLDSAEWRQALARAKALAAGPLDRPAAEFLESAEWRQGAKAQNERLRQLAGAKAPVQPQAPRGQVCGLVARTRLFQFLAVLRMALYKDLLRGVCWA